MSRNFFFCVHARRVGVRTGDLEKWPCWNELSQPRPNRLLSCHFLRSPIRTPTRRACTQCYRPMPMGGKLPFDGGNPGTRDHTMVRESHHYPGRLGLMRDLAMWFCWSELLPPKPNRLRSGPRLLGQVISDRAGAYSASAAKARSNNPWYLISFFHLFSYNVTTVTWKFMTESSVFHGESWF